jgi:hypothetical protein
MKRGNTALNVFAKQKSSNVTSLLHLKCLGERAMSTGIYCRVITYCADLTRHCTKGIRNCLNSTGSPRGPGTLSAGFRVSRFVGKALADYTFKQLFCPP